MSIQRCVGGVPRPGLFPLTPTLPTAPELPHYRCVTARLKAEKYKACLLGTRIREKETVLFLNIFLLIPRGRQGEEEDERERLIGCQRDNCQSPPPSSLWNCLGWNPSSSIHCLFALEPVHEAFGASVASSPR